MKNIVTVPFRAWALWVGFVFHLSKHLLAGMVALVLAILAWVGIDAHLRHVYADPVETRYESKLRKAREENREATKARQEARWEASSEKASRRDAERDLRRAIHALRELQETRSTKGWHDVSVEEVADRHKVSLKRRDLDR